MSFKCDKACTVLCCLPSTILEKDMVPGRVERGSEITALLICASEPKKPSAVKQGLYKQASSQDVSLLVGVYDGVKTSHEWIQVSMLSLKYHQDLS